MSIHLAPDVETSLREEAAARGISLDDLVAYVVAQYVRNRPLAKGSTTAASADRQQEMKWAARPDPHYLGKWVVLQGNEVIASGPDPKAIYEDVRARGVVSPFLIYVSPEENEPFIGGWLD